MEARISLGEAMKKAGVVPLTTQSFGEIIRGLRKDTGMSLAQLSTRVGASKEEIMAWEHDEEAPKGVQLARLRSTFKRLKDVKPVVKAKAPTALPPEAKPHHNGKIIATKNIDESVKVVLKAPAPTTHSSTPIMVSTPSPSPLTIETKTEEMYSRVEDIDPDLARLLLSGNVRNRSVSRATVEKYYRDIISGRWQTTHQSIALDREGRLLDGQHRLLAIIKANQTVKLYVTYNAPPESFPIIDGNRIRSHSDMLHLSHGMKNSSQVTASLKLIFRLGLLTGAPASFTWDEVEALYEKFGADCQWAAARCTATGMRLSGVIAAVTYAYPCSKEKVEEFVTTLNSRMNMTAPMVALWKAVERLSKTTNSSATAVDLAMVTLRCLQAHEKGESLLRVYKQPNRKKGNEERESQADVSYRYWRHRRDRLKLPL
jgi:transcriptional regulator with XRE-family HTH domain